MDGQAGSIYKQYPPLVNACKAPGEWQQPRYHFTAPLSVRMVPVINPARITVIQNGVLVQNNSTIWGNTVYRVRLRTEKHDAKESILLAGSWQPDKLPQYLDQGTVERVCFPCR